MLNSEHLKKYHFIYSLIFLLGIIVLITLTRMFHIPAADLPNFFKEAILSINFKAVLNGIWVFAVAFIVFSITVFVHEFGHFLAARKMGLIVERFAIGFGPKIKGWKRDGVEYAINWLPFGGFVQLPQMAEMEMVEGKSEKDASKLPPASPWAKAVTAFAGPFFSFLLALALACIVWFTGIPQNKDLLTTTIGYIEPNSPAAKAGLQAGDRIVKINGKPVERWAGRTGGITEAILLSVGKTVSVEIERGKGQFLTFSIVPEKDPEMEGLRSLGFEKYFARALVVDYVIKNSPAEKAGIQVGDRVVEVDGQPVYSSVDLSKRIFNSKSAMNFTYLRDGKRSTISITPQKAVNHHTQMIGVIWKVTDDQLTQISPVALISNSLTFIYRTLRAVVNPDSDVGVRHLSGPIGIFDKLMSLLTIDPRLVLYFGVVLNVNLAVINLLPIPILDGGHIMLCLIEAIRRRPMEAKVLYAVQMTFFFVLIGLFIFITYHDIWRIGKRVIQKPAPAFEMPKFESDSQDNTQ